MAADPALPLQQEHLRPSEALAPDTWWDHYRTLLDRSLSTTSIEVVDTDADYIVSRCVLPVDSSDGWGPSRVRKGLVMGAVQSGKTASMIAVAAKALDAGVDMIVVLGGTRVALWQQTFQRLADQLDFDGGSASLSTRRVWCPNPDAGSDVLAETDLRHTYRLMRPQVERAVRKRIPLVVVAMKNGDHLRQLALELRQSLVPAIDSVGRPFHMLVIDDEADDGSVLDARTELATTDQKQIPRYIVDLWDSRPHGRSTASEHLFATYMAYTATPQANFLQEDFNPLAPTDFAVALRTPSGRGDLEPRQPTYRDDTGVKGWYTGGDFFYERMPSLCASTEAYPRDEDVLPDALKAFLVAAALRLDRAGESVLGPASASTRVFDSLAQVRKLTHPPMSMLIHPSATKDVHFKVAHEVLGWASGLGSEDGALRYERGERLLSIEGIQRSMEVDEPSWVEWLRRYRESSRALAKECDIRPRHVPGTEDWDLVRSYILDEIVPVTKVAVINSDEKADDRPRFQPVHNEAGWQPAPDAVTIFVSGNVMSRGLTLEGLTTTAFTRRTDAPLADTQMQMQRWFGYRGSYLDLCRVFMTTDQVDLFRAYHESDEALRRNVMTLMNETPGAPDPRVLQGLDYSATGKIAGVTSAPLSPGAHPFFPRVADGLDSSELANRLAAMFVAERYQVVGSPAAPRGLLLDRKLDLLEAADLLDAMRFPLYAPGTDGWEARRWSALEKTLDSLEGPAAGRLYRPPIEGHGDQAASSCPYSTAAYLRLWHACLTRHVPGLYPTDDARTPWSLIDLQTKAAQQPKFRVGLRLGSGDGVTSGPLTALSERLPMVRRSMREPRVVTGRWGAHNPSVGVSGDEYFDLIELKEPLPVPRGEGRPWRPSGTDGMLLFHVVDVAGQPGLVLGASIPLGGPNQFAAQTQTDLEHDND